MIKRIILIIFCILIIASSGYLLYKQETYYQNEIKILQQNQYYLAGVNNLLRDEISNLKLINMNANGLLVEYETLINDYTTKLSIYEDTVYEFPVITNAEIDMLSRTVYGEAKGCNAYEQSMVIWCILNRLDDGRWGNRLTTVITYPNQFHGYKSSYPIVPEIRKLVEDVLIRWRLEKMFGWDVGRTLPSDIMYFHAGRTGENINHNMFYKYLSEQDGTKQYYDWKNKSHPYT